jgi:hypothetical protein
VNSPALEIVAALGELDDLLGHVTSPALSQSLHHLRERLQLAAELLGVPHDRQSNRDPDAIGAPGEDGDFPITPAATASKRAEPAEPKVTHVYCGVVPPWDVSLGDYRDFTPAERKDPRICRPLARDQADSNCEPALTDRSQDL